MSTRGYFPPASLATLVLASSFSCACTERDSNGPPLDGGSAGAVSSAGDTGTSGSGGSSGTSGSSGDAGSAGASGLASNVRWLGRVDTSNAKGPEFAWSATGFAATVAGDSIAVTLESSGGSDPVYFQPVVDGVPGPRLFVASSEGPKTLQLASGLGAGNHEVELYRETEGKPGFALSTFLGFASGTPQAPPQAPGRLIEVVGDSISAGYGALGTEQHPSYGPDPNGGCSFTTETESAYVTYGAVAARALGADVNIIAASGWGIYSDNGGNLNDVLPSVYANTLGGSATPAWGFSPEPQAVVVNLGTNDFSASMTLTSELFTPPYVAFLQTIRSKYPDAWIYCAIGSLLYGTGLSNATKYINALVTDLKNAGDGKIKVLNFGQQNSSLGTGCSYHPNVTEHQRMAGLLTQELKTTLGW